MGDRLEMLSVEQLNSAVSFVNAVSAQSTQAKLNATTGVTRSLGKTDVPAPAVINNGPVMISLNQKPGTVLNLPAARSINQPNIISSANCISLPVIAEDKPVIIGQPIQQIARPIQQIQTIPTFTSCPMSSVMTIPTLSSGLASSAVSTSSNIQQRPIQIQGASILPQTTQIAQNVSECLLTNQLAGVGHTVLPSSTGTFIIAEDGTLQISNSILPNTQNQVQIQQPQQQRQQPLIFLAPQNGNNSNIGNAVATGVATEHNTPFILEVSSATSNTQNFGSVPVGNHTTAVQSVSSNRIQTLPSFKVIAAKPTVPPSSAGTITLCPSKPSVNKTPKKSDILPTILIKKTLRDCHSGTVVEMVERMVPASKQQTKSVAQNGHSEEECEKFNQLITNGSYCIECDKMYCADDECIQHGSLVSEVADTPVLSRARMTVPALLQLKGVKEAGQVGIFTCQGLKKKTRFGPLIGSLQNFSETEHSKKELPMQWKIFDKGKCVQICDCSKEDSSNWMRFVRAAKSNEEQNTVAYQQGKDIWFMTMKDIPPETELLYWYSNEYSTLLGSRKKPSDFFKCGVCGKESQDYTKLKSHLNYVHSGLTQKKHQCQICARSFPGKGKLNTHVLGHLGVKPYVCNVCGKQFTDQSNLRLHKDIHTGEKRFHCSQCGRAFRQKAHLMTHYLVHSGEKKLKCKYCEKLFARASDLRSHERSMHTKEKKYMCLVLNCHKVFHKLSVYKKHMLIHSNKKDFHCLSCGKTFFTKYHLARHTKACKGENKGKRVKDYTDAPTHQDAHSLAGTSAVS